MSENYKLTGGARIGMANASYPFADLYVDKNILKINASIVGNFVFRPEDIISIETYNFIPLIAQGIKINHKIANYNSKIIFWTFNNPETVLTEIKKTGFLENNNTILFSKDQEIIDRQKLGGFPIKKNVAIFYVIIWNILLLSNFIPFFLNFSENKSPFGIGVITAVSLLFFSATLTLISQNFRNIILKDGRNFEDIKKFIYLLLFISGFILLHLIIMKIAIE